MSTYEFRLFDELGTLFHISDYRHADDLSALDHAVEFSQTDAVEIWRGGFCVARLKKGNIALNERDRTSL